MTTKLIIANWKTYITHLDALALGKQLPLKDNLIVAPSIAHLAFIKEHLPGVNLAAQDISGVAKEYGSYTGEVPAQMLSDMSIKYAIIGHSERRNKELDNSKTIAAKVSHCLESSIVPIICIGETQEERQNNQYLDSLTTQLLNIRKVLEDYNSPKITNSQVRNESVDSTLIGTGIIGDYKLNNTRSQVRSLSLIGEHYSDDVGLILESPIIVGYEPVWSVGTGVLPSKEEISEIMNLIRSTLNIASKLILVYGGSISAENAKDIVNIAGVDGVLIGKASTDFAHFKSIIDIIR